MTVSSLNILSIIELVFYAPATPIAIFLCVRHGFHFQMGWLFLMIFCFIRITEASLQLNSIPQPSNIVFMTVPITLSSVGVATLLLTLLGLINRLRIMISLEYPINLHFRFLVFLRILTILGLACCSSGGGIAGSNFARTGVYKVFITTKIGTLLLIAALLFMAVLMAIIANKRGYLHGNEKTLLITMAVSIPLLAIRIVYGILCAWINKDDFKTLGGSVAVMGCMSVLEEFLVVIVWELAGLSLQKVPKRQIAPNEKKNKLVELWKRFNVRCCGHRKRGETTRVGMEDVEKE